MYSMKTPQRKAVPGQLVAECGGVPAEKPHALAATTPETPKLFTKALLQRIRPDLPAVRCGQLCARTGGQVLDGALAAQQLTYIAAQYGLPLLLLKLDTAAAFDSVEHPAVSRLFCACKPSRESQPLLNYILLSAVTLRLGHQSWTQQLHKDLLQGTPFSEGLFGRLLDYFLADAWESWSETFRTWIETRGQNLHAILYADDVRRIAMSYEELGRKLRDVQAVLRPLGLKLALEKYELMVSHSKSCLWMARSLKMLAPESSWAFCWATQLRPL